MLKRYALGLLVLVVPMFVARTMSYAQSDPVEHLWYNDEKTAKIQIYKAVDGKFYGKIAWLKEPNRDGKPKLDMNNSDKARRNDPELGLLIIKGFKKSEDNLYEDGTVYDPKNGKTYSCKMTLEGDHLNVRGFVGFSLLGRTAKWVRAD